MSKSCVKKNLIEKNFQFFEIFLKTLLGYSEIFFGHLRTVWSLRKSIQKILSDLRLITILGELKIWKNIQKICQKTQKM